MKLLNRDGVMSCDSVGKYFFSLLEGHNGSRFNGRKQFEFPESFEIIKVLLMPFQRLSMATKKTFSIHETKVI